MGFNWIFNFIFTNTYNNNGINRNIPNYLNFAKNLLKPWNIHKINEVNKKSENTIIFTQYRNIYQNVKNVKYVKMWKWGNRFTLCRLTLGAYVPH